MRAVDTHVLVRLITRDDDAQTLAAERFVAPGAWVSVLVLADATRVLATVYALRRKQFALAIEMLLAHEQLVIQDADVVSTALSDFRRASTVGFSDCLVLALARAAGHLPLGTFDRRLTKLEGAVSPAAEVDSTRSRANRRRCVIRLRGGSAKTLAGATGRSFWTAQVTRS